MRCRWVARDFKVKGDGRENLFAAMPPLEAKKTLFALAAPKLKGRTTKRGKKMKLMFIDVRKAHLNAKVDEAEDIYVELPEEAGAYGKCGKLWRWLYGMRGAAQGWEADYTERLESIGFKRGKASPAVFHSESAETVVVVHGDDSPAWVERKSCCN